MPTCTEAIVLNRYSPEQQALAQLYASAPALFEACQKALATFERHRWDHGNDWTEEDARAYASLQGAVASAQPAATPAERSK